METSTQTKTPAAAGANALAEAWESLQQTKPGIRIREAARALEASEAELLATKIGPQVVRLQGPWPELLRRFTTLGRVMSLTRNDACILEHKGPFQEIDIIDAGPRSMATVIGPIESRVFFHAWHVAFAATEEKTDRVLKSIQVFDRSGEAVTKIYLQEKSDEEAYARLLEDFRSPDQSPEQPVSVYAAEVLQGPESEAAFLQEWGELKDTHDFFGMLRRHKVDRYHALEVARGKYTYQVNAKATPQLILEQAAAQKLPIMIFAGNRGNLQIHQGKVRTIRLLERGHNGPEPWLNVLDPDFNMHLRMDLVDTAWVVKKNTTEGFVTSVELFDKQRNLVAQFFGLRKPGIPEKLEWRSIVENLPAL
ncbi:hemin-degrading factor [Parachryseolinea silvisoli]|uniref:hemin-degrading factor n=1 Tax=Parachryseolinea silvisoli TaxID=2873601 RepID=UPI002265A9D9|nr:ChuX/HutX family heme-like substrate-binding protein [Parachryseolinea silvisoli]MCD9013914.1 hemin-degrading factor [Parachryseolinea silvisoli]